MSLDAVIKYFASGFIIATSLAMVIETLISLLVGLIISFMLIIAIVFELSISERLEEDWANDPTAAMKELIKDNTWVFVLFMFLNAFAVAAMTEELCKYFSFWMVEHPDLMPREELGIVTATGEGGHDQEDNGGVPEDIGTEASPQMLSKSNNPAESLNSTGTGITIAMVAAATGFACCENIGYVFFRSSKVEEGEIILLRSE